MKELRYIDLACELRDNNSDNRTVTGYALKFNKLSRDMGGWYETISPNALDGVLERSDVLCLMNHDMSRGILARCRCGSGSLKLTVDNIGLRYEFSAPNTSLGDELVECLKRGDIFGSSFGFTIAENGDTWDRTEDDKVVRTINKFDMLFDVSPVYHPAYLDADVQIAKRGYDAFIEQEISLYENETVETDMNDKRNKELLKYLNNVIEILTEKRSEEEQEKEENSCDENSEDKREEETEKDSEDKVERNDEENENSEETEEVSSEENDDEERSEDEEETEENENSDEDTDEENEEVNSEEENEDKTEKRNININMSKFSILTAVRDLVEGRQFDSVTAEVNKRGLAEMRAANIAVTGRSLTIPGTEIKKAETRGAILAGTAGAGQEIVAEQKADLFVALKERLVAAQAGATILTNCKSDISIPFYSGTTASWKSEGAAADRGEGTFTEKFLRPKRLSAQIYVSRQFLLQDTIGAEQALTNDIVNALAVQLEKTMFGDGAGSAFEPAGLFNGVSAESSAFTYADSVLYEAELEKANVYGNNFHYVLSPASKAIARATSTDAGSGVFVMQNNEINGLPVLSSGVVVDKGLLVGDFSELWIAYFGGITLTYDPYTKCDEDVIRLVATCYVDYCVRNEDAIVKKILA